MEEQLRGQQGFNSEEKWGMTKIKQWNKRKKNRLEGSLAGGSKGPQEWFQLCVGEPEGDGGPPSWKKVTLKKPVHRGSIPRK